MRSYWLAQDAVIEAMRRYATDHHVHVCVVSACLRSLPVPQVRTQVAHPRKDAEGTRYDLASIHGTGKLTQEADNVLVLQRDKENK